MSNERSESTPSERFRSLMAAIRRPSCIAEIERGIQNPVRDPGEIMWRDDSDPFGGNWDWLTQNPDAGEQISASPIAE